MFKGIIVIHIRLIYLATLAICTIFLYSCHTSKMAIDKIGFIQIFNGKNLNKWIGDSTYWHVEDRVQVHVGPPMRVAFRNIRMKKL